MRTRLPAAVLAILAALSIVLPARADTYPSRPIMFVVAYAPGGTGDVVARLIANKLGPVLGQSVVVENRAGASGAIGAQYVARAQPDGYTVLVGQTAEVVINQYLRNNLGYDSEKDLAPVALGADAPLVMATPAKSPYASLDALLKAARTSNGLTFASAGVGTPGHIAGEFLKVRSKTNLLHVPYKGDALKDVIAGRVNFFFSGYPAAMPLAHSGSVKILAVSSAQRLPSLPDAPTVREVTGIKDFDLTVWQGFFVPRGTPADVISRLNAAINKVLEEPDVKQTLSEAGAYVHPMSIDAFAKFVTAQRQKYKEMIKETGIVAQ